MALESEGGALVSLSEAGSGIFFLVLPAATVTKVEVLRQGVQGCLSGLFVQSCSGFKENPKHRSLHFKNVGKYWSAKNWNKVSGFGS